MLVAAILMAISHSSGPDLASLLSEVDPKRIRETVEHLAAFNTRNTNTPELIEAANWMADQYRKIPGLQVELMKYQVEKGRRVPEDKQVVQVVAVLPGTDDRRIIMGGHMDSINMQPDADVYKSRAPGANDDLSGAAATLEVARIMSQRKWPHTLVFVAFTGEEQGLLGSRALAKRAAEEGWKIDAVLSNDMIGSSGNKLGEKDTKRVRVFSEESERTAEKPHNSRELARFIEWTTRGKVKNFGVKLVFRKDRFGRGGDHSPFNDLGFNGVRFTEVFEEYSRQHTPDDLPEFMDWSYLANSARINLATMVSLAVAGDPPKNVRIKMDQSQDTTLSWSGTKGTPYIVYWRETTSPTWEGSREVGESETVVIPRVNKDDHIFAVGAAGGVPVLAH